MTEEEWLVCENVTIMLNQIRRNASDRKLRLFCCGYLRGRVTNVYPSVNEAVEVAEIASDGQSQIDAWRTRHSSREEIGPAEAVLLDDVAEALFDRSPIEAAK